MVKTLRMLQASATQLPGSYIYLYIDWLELGKCVHSHWSSTSWGMDNVGLTSSPPRRLQQIRLLAEAEGSHPVWMTSERPETPCSSHTLSASNGGRVHKWEKEGEERGKGRWGEGREVIITIYTNTHMGAGKHTAEVKVSPLVNSHWVFEGSPRDVVWKGVYVYITVCVYVCIFVCLSTWLQISKM